MSTIIIKNIKALHALFLVASITIIIIIFDVLFLFKLKTPYLQENRQLVAQPSIPTTFADWNLFPGQVDAYINDNFPPRAHLIGYMNFVRYSLGYSVSPKVFVGRDGWMFYNNDTNMAFAAGHQYLAPASLTIWGNGFAQRLNYVELNGGKFYAMFAPVKESIFPEYRPGWMPKEVVHTEVDDFIHEVRLRGIDQIVDPRPALISAKKTGKQIWHKYDTHWTGLGAYEAYVSLMQRINKDFPNLQPLPLSAFRETNLSTEQTPRDLSLMLGVAGFLSHSTISYATTPIHDLSRTIFLTERKDWTSAQILTTDATENLSLLLMRDSFSIELLPFLKAHFRTIITTHVQDGFFRKDMIDQYRPDIVILEIIEPGARFAMEVLPDL